MVSDLNALDNNQLQDRIYNCDHTIPDTYCVVCFPYAEELAWRENREERREDIRNDSVVTY